MPDDFSDPQDGQDASSLSMGESGLSQEGIQAMQGPADQPTAPADQPKTPDQPVAPAQPETPPEAPPKTIVGERGMAEWIESGAEKPEKEIFPSFGGGLERGG